MATTTTVIPIAALLFLATCICPDFANAEKELQELTVEQLRRFNGVEEERIYLAVFGKVYDVTGGKAFYGPGGMYGAMAGHDATRAFAKFDVQWVRDEFDHLEGLDEGELETAREWEQRISAKYPLVGKLLPPGQEPKGGGEL